MYVGSVELSRIEGPLMLRAPRVTPVVVDQGRLRARSGYVLTAMAGRPGHRRKCMGGRQFRWRCSCAYVRSPRLGNRYGG